MSASAIEMVVGLEVHVQLRTRTKAFCGCSTAFGARPNANTCPVCLALPGALPVLNAEAVRLALRAAAALDCTIHPVSTFARKHYVYPDLPKGYQITQYDRPLATRGHLVLEATRDGAPVRVGIARVHIEEDAGKSIHDRFAGATAVDLNRAGVPLIEIVSEPDVRSSAEAGAYLRALKRILAYIDVSDVNMEEGSLRVDANVSIRPRGERGLGTKTEVKNLNSFSAVERALDAEYARHVARLERGLRVDQETMLWDVQRAEVRPARGKEASHDYRYFPEPDLPPLVLDAGVIARLAASLPELPAARRQRFVTDLGLPHADADVLTHSPRVADYFEQVARAHGDPTMAANWVRGEVLAALHARREAIDDFPVAPTDLAQLLDLVRSGDVSNSAAKRIFARMTESKAAPAWIARDEGLLRIGDDAALDRWIDQVIEAHPEEARRFLAGERRLQGVLVGLVMKASGGTADPKRVNQLLGSRAGS